jgi:P4 family phage/plasmid primase-like protien
MLRSKASDFDYNTIPDLYNQWKNYFHKKEDGVTRRSIMYWAKQDAYEDFCKVKNNSIENFIEETLNTQTDFDFAQVLYQMFKDKYVCTSITNKTWYNYKNHRWEPDKGLSLRLAISKDMHNLYKKKLEDYTNEMQNHNPNDEIIEHIKRKSKSLCEICVKLKKTNDKNNIMRESMEIFYDKEFVKKMDSNKYLLCFNNGVVDFKSKTFRDGYPQDYITKTTNIDYIPLNRERHSNTIQELTEFMEKLFPVVSLNKYMWEHLASCLIGTNLNQTFNIYRGSGSNGKSILTDLMSQGLGEYKGTVPITLVTEKRNGIGGTSSEIVQLKGIRYAVMQEPSKETKINEGIMKELTGGDPVQGRALYSESEIFEPQFKLVVCTNSLFEINSNDDGTWRRIRICDFLSKFIDEDEVHTDDTSYVFKKDKSLKERLPILAPIFMSMLVDIAFKTDGVVSDSEIVMAASNRYRQGQDHITAFINEMVIKTGNSNDRIKKTELTNQFKIWYQESQGSKNMPKGAELYEYMEKKFGKVKCTGWHGIKINYQEEMDLNIQDLDG